MVLGIYGIGGVGRETLDIARAMQTTGKQWKDVVFVDDNKFGQNVHGVEVIAFEDALGRYGPCGMEMSVAVGEPESKRMLREKLSKAGIKLANVIHPDAYIARSARFGDGLIMREGAKLSCDCVVGENVCFENYAILGHDGLMGDDCQVSTFSAIAGNCKVGNQVYFGLGSMIKEGMSIGNYAIVGMSACILRDVPPQAIMMGNPARVMGTNERKRVFGLR